MKRLLIGVLVMISASAMANIESYLTVDNGDGTVTVRPYRSTNLKDKCGYDLDADIRIGGTRHKNKICRALGYDSYVRNSLVINHHGIRYIGTILESISNCVGAPVGNSKAIKSISCYIEEEKY